MEINNERRSVRREFFTADTHFGHWNIAKYCHRPFLSVEEMDQTLLDAINRVVGPHDILYHLGDFCWWKGERTAQWYRDQINCRTLIMVAGNHDPHYADCTPKKEFAQMFSQCYQNLRIKSMLQNGAQVEIWLSHYAHLVWNKSHHGVWHFYGHGHGTMLEHPNGLAFDVGVDAVAKRLGCKPENYRPLSLEEVNGIMQERASRLLLKDGNLYDQHKSVRSVCAV